MAQNGLNIPVEQHIKAMDALGGLKVLGTPKADNMYHAGWAWAGSTPYKATKLIASHFGGTRNPMAVRWPAKIKPDPTPRTQFHHVNDVSPTLYELIGITPPRVVNGIPQDPIDGVSFAYTFNDPKAKGRLLSQYFEIMGSRAIYHDGWIASAFGPRIPWVPGLPKGAHEWTPDKDKWELYNLEEDWSQANDLADKMPDKLAQMKDVFLIEFAKNQGFPIGGGLWVPVLHPELRIAPPYREWSFGGDFTRMPEFLAPALGNKPNLVTIEAEIPEGANGVLYALGGFSGGLACYVKDGSLCYEYNLFEVMRTQIKAKEKLPLGKVKIEVQTSYVVPKPGGPLRIVLNVNDKQVDVITTVNGKEVDRDAKVGELTFAPGVVPVSAPLLFTANDCLDIGTDLGSPVSLDYFDKAPFKFSGNIEKVHVKYVR
jgi:arylsulfatase